MKITRKQLRRMLHEVTEDLSIAEKLAENFRKASLAGDLAHVRHVFLTAVALEHAQEGTLNILESIGRPIISFVATSELKSALRQKFSRFKSTSLDEDFHPGMHKIAYSA